jgi:hypothetical protein
MAWYGVWDTRNGRWAYAGFFINEDATGLYADMEYPGDRRDERAKLDKVSKAALEQARVLFPNGKSGDSHKTWLSFARILEPEIVESKESSDYYLEWFTRILSDVKQVFR